MERIDLSVQEVKRLEILRQVSDGVLTQGMAAEILGLTVRQVGRLQRRYEASGAAGLVSRRRGKPTNRRLSQEVEEAILARLRECDADFGPTLAAEDLRGEGLPVSQEILRGWMMEAQFWQAARARRVRLHPPRPRRPDGVSGFRSMATHTTGSKAEGRAAR